MGFLGRTGRAFGETAVFRRGVKITSGFDEMRDGDDDDDEVGEG